MANSSSFIETEVLLIKGFYSELHFLYITESETYTVGVKSIIEEFFLLHKIQFSLKTHHEILAFRLLRTLLHWSSWKEDNLNSQFVSKNKGIELI